MNYCVRGIDNMTWLASPEGILHFASVNEAKIAGVVAGRSFMVVEEVQPYRCMMYGLMTAQGFLMLDGTLQNGDTSSGPDAAGSSPVGADQKEVRPLV